MISCRCASHAQSVPQPWPVDLQCRCRCRFLLLIPFLALFLGRHSRTRRCESGLGGHHAKSVHTHCHSARLAPQRSDLAGPPRKSHSHSQARPASAKMRRSREAKDKKSCRPLTHTMIRRRPAVPATKSGRYRLIDCAPAPGCRRRGDTGEEKGRGSAARTVCVARAGEALSLHQAQVRGLVHGSGSSAGLRCPSTFIISYRAAHRSLAFRVPSRGFSRPVAPFAASTLPAMHRSIVL